MENQFMNKYQSVNYQSRFQLCNQQDYIYTNIFLWKSIDQLSKQQVSNNGQFQNLPFSHYFGNVSSRSSLLCFFQWLISGKTLFIFSIFIKLIYNLSIATEIQINLEIQRCHLNSSNYAITNYDCQPEFPQIEEIKMNLEPHFFGIVRDIIMYVTFQGIS